MPASPLDELGLIGQSYAILAAVAVPVAITIRRCVPASRRAFRLAALPDLEAIVIIALALLLPPLVLSSLDVLKLFAYLPVDTPEVRSALAGLLSLLLWLAWVTLLLARSGRRPLLFLQTRSLREISLGIFAFLIITPITFAVHLLVTALVLAFGGTVDRHPLQDFSTATPFSIACFIVTACVVAPIMEEAIFRGILLPWAQRRRFRPWLIFALAVVMLIAGKGLSHIGTLFFLADLTVVMACCAGGRQVWRKWPPRTASAVFSTAALFGAMHAAVWPTPVPLTVMGIGLGILTVRCGNLRPAIVVHALFNGVTVLALLRS